MTASDVKYLKEAQKKVNKAAEQQSQYADQCHAASVGAQNTNEGGILDLAETAQALGISQVQVSRLEKKILLRLREKMDC